MPLYDFECTKCGTVFEDLVKAGQIHTVQCPECEAVEVQRLISKIGGYSIHGVNSSSATPKQAGSFKKK